MRVLDQAYFQPVAVALGSGSAEQQEAAATALFYLSASADLRPLIATTPGLLAALVSTVTEGAMAAREQALGALEFLARHGECYVCANTRSRVNTAS